MKITPATHSCLPVAAPLLAKPHPRIPCERPGATGDEDAFFQQWCSRERHSSAEGYLPIAIVSEMH